MAEWYNNLSLRLYEILDWIGASEETRARFREHAIVDEILSTHIRSLKDGNQTKKYVLGSYGEGTTTQGLGSDYDSLYCIREPVVDNISHSPENGHSLLMVTDETTHPGYYKLQQVNDKIPMDCVYAFVHNIDFSYLAKEHLKPDHYGRICLENLHVNGDLFREANGPAMTRSVGKGERDQDLVLAARCQYVPRCANSWLKRVINSDRLNDAQIRILKESGCFFVGIKHPSSRNGPMEWRISFSLQERELMVSLNSTQHKCYVLLKIIKKDIISKRAHNSISSYHCKTCVLYAIEKKPCVFWRRGNLLECLRFCILLLLQWVRKNRCPNYFIPDENMFDRLEKGSLRQVQAVLEDMLLHWCGFLWSLKCDSIGEVLNVVLFGCGPSTMRVKGEIVSEQSQMLCRNFSTLLRAILTQLSIMYRSRSANKAVLVFCIIEYIILNTGCVEDHTEEETQLAMIYIMPYLRLQIAQCMASVMLTTRNEDRLRKMFRKFKYYIAESKDCDVTSSYLIAASYLLHVRHDVCERFLLKCETSLKSHVITLCDCNNRKHIYMDEACNVQLRIFRSHSIQNKEYSRTYTSGCLTFLPHQANLVHPALHYEMYRSVNTPAESRHKMLDQWFDWIVVDSKVYLYFLQYVLYSKTNKPNHKQDAIDNLIHIVNRFENFGHLETAYNLLGWIFTQENKIQQAMEYFRTSWRIRPIHNAAKWHILQIIGSRNTRY